MCLLGYIGYSQKYTTLKQRWSYLCFCLNIRYYFSAYMQNELKRPEVREEIMALSSDKYGVDLAKKPKDSEPQASFRKLNVS